ncbi:hypothetical protein FB107DRAFT_280126 [Schizophyllum commune]
MGDIDLSPPYQRDVVWSDAKQVQLIGSILHNFYIPPIIFSVKTVKGEDHRTCIDGKQRLTSLVRFMDGLIYYENPETLDRWWYKDFDKGTGSQGPVRLMPDNARKSFANKPVVCVEYSRIDKAQEREIFSRVQLGIALSASERLAIIDTPRSNFVRHLIETFLYMPSLRRIEWDQSRGADFRAVASALYVVQHYRADPAGFRQLPDVEQLSVWLSDEDEIPHDARATITEAFTALATVAGGTHGPLFLRPAVEVALVEVVMFVVLAAVNAKKSEPELALLLKDMRIDVREQHPAIRNNNKVAATMLSFVHRTQSRSAAPVISHKRKATTSTDELRYAPGTSASGQQQFFVDPNALRPMSSAMMPNGSPRIAPHDVRRIGTSSMIGPWAARPPYHPMAGVSVMPGRQGTWRGSAVRWEMSSNRPSRYDTFFDALPLRAAPSTQAPRAAGSAPVARRRAPPALDDLGKKLAQRARSFAAEGSNENVLGRGGDDRRSDNSSRSLAVPPRPYNADDQPPTTSQTPMTQSRAHSIIGAPDARSGPLHDPVGDDQEEELHAVDEAGHDLFASTVLQVDDKHPDSWPRAEPIPTMPTVSSSFDPPQNPSQSNERPPAVTPQASLWNFLHDTRTRNKATEKAIEAADSVNRVLQQCERMLRNIRPSDARSFIIQTLSSVEDMVMREGDKLSRIKRPEARAAVARAAATLETVKTLLKTYSLLYPDATPIRIDNAHLRMELVDGLQSATLVAYCLALTARIFHGISREGANVVLKLTKLYGHSLVHLGGGPNILQQQALRDTPVDIRTVEKRVNLGIRTIPHAVCPTCRCTYEPTYLAGSSRPQYPRICREDADKGAGTLCNASLVDESGSPRDVFEYYPFFDWFGRLIALPEIEALGDQFCERVDQQRTAPAQKFGVEDGSLIRSIPAHDHQGRFFIADRGSEKRWLFALHVDFFNAEGNRIRGRTASTGHIVMTCLNLPLHMRNDDAYKYLVGVIKGPEEPRAKEGEIRYYIRPLIRDIKLAYIRGVRFRYSGCTGLHDASEELAYRHVHRMVIAALIADLKAARPCGGLMDVSSHHFCSVCRCWILAHLGRVDFESWRGVDDEVLRKAAKVWQASPRNLRKVIEELYAARDSELWELEYWTPSRQLVVDPMHTWFLIVLQRFFREAMRLDAGMKDSTWKRRPAFHHSFTPPPPLSPPAPSSSTTHDSSSYRIAIQVGLIQKALVAPMPPGAEGKGKLDKKLQTYTVAALATDLIDVLVAWRMTKPLLALPWTRIDYDSTIGMIRRVIRECGTPTWLKDKPPLDLGELRAGTLKANQWRWLYRLYVPLALIYMWHPESPHAVANSGEMKPILDMNMDLTCATIQVVKHTVTEAGQKMFRERLRHHVLALRQYFPGFIFPGYHLAFHIPDFMSLLGPARNWWCFPFERLAGKLQRIPKSHKAGQSEHTMLHSFVKGAIFRQWLLRPDVPQILQYCRSLVEQAYRFVGADSSEDAEDADSNEPDGGGGGDDRDEDDEEDGPDADFLDDPLDNHDGPSTGTHSGDPAVDHRTHAKVTPELRRLLGTDSISCYKRAYAPKGFYSTAGTNSRICVVSKDRTTVRWNGARIRYIYVQRGHVRFVIQRAAVLQDGSVDVFSLYWWTGFEALRVSDQFSQHLEIVKPEQVLGHAAKWGLGDGSAVFVNLSDLHAWRAEALGRRGAPSDATQAYAAAWRAGDQDGPETASAASTGSSDLLPKAITASPLAQPTMMSTLMSMSSLRASSGQVDAGRVQTTGLDLLRAMAGLELHLAEVTYARQKKDPTPPLPWLLQSAKISERVANLLTGQAADERPNSTHGVVAESVESRAMQRPARDLLRNTRRIAAEA